MQVLKNISYSPSDYLDTAVIAKEAGEELLSRLQFMSLNPKVIVDIGSGPGILSDKLQAQYPSASIFAVDYVEEMLQAIPKELSQGICSMGERLPFRDQSVDLIFANFYLPWQANFEQALKEWRRVLRPDGIVLLTALGPDTLKESYDAFGSCIIPAYIDMHDLGDMLLKEGFIEPVLDINYYCLQYDDKAKLVNELTSSSILQKSATSVTFQNLEVTFEIIYAHAFAPEPCAVTSKEGITQVPLSYLRDQLRAK